MTAQRSWAQVQRQLATRPHLPIVAWIALAGTVGLMGGGLVPESMQTSLPLWLAQTWTVAIAAGASAATAGCITESTRTESLGLGFTVYGVTFYGLVVAVFNWPASFLTFVLCAAVAFMCIIRMRVLSLSRKAVTRARGGENDGY